MHAQILRLVPVAALLGAAACRESPTDTRYAAPAFKAAGNQSADPGQKGPFEAGFTHFVIHDANRDNRPIAISVWYPVDHASIGASATPARYPLDAFTGTLPLATSTDFEAFGIDRAYQEPPASRGPYPLVIFSPGFGDTFDQYAYVGARLATHGIVVGILTHWGDGYSGSPGEPVDAVEVVGYNRPRDMSRALDALLDRSSMEGDLLDGTIDPQRVAASGHSIGGYATMVLAGGDDLVCDMLDASTAPPSTCVPSLPDPRFGSIVTVDGSNGFLRFYELARVHVPAMGIGSDSARTAVAMAILWRQHAAFSGHPNYRVDVHNPVADPMAYHMAFSSVCASLGVYQKYPEMAQLWLPSFQFWLDWWCPPEALPPQEMHRRVTKYMISFLETDQPVLAPGYAITSEPGVAFFVTEPGNPRATGVDDPTYAYFIGQPGAATAQAAKDPPHPAPVRLGLRRH